jgi:Fe-S-cluster containining protein
MRSDLELLLDHPEEPAGLLVYDPARRTIFELEVDDELVLRLLDGSRRPREIAQEAGRALDDVLDLIDDLSDLLLLEDFETSELIDEWRQQYEAEDELLQPILTGRPTMEIAGWPVRVVDDARHTCVCCGDCCHYAVPISPETRHRLGEQAWLAQVVPEEVGRLFQLRPGTQWGRLEGVIATQSDPTRCAFLDDKDLCRVHRRLGREAKPFACRLFPLAYPVSTSEEVIVSLTFECPWIFQSYETGERLAEGSERLRSLVSEMEEMYVLPQEIPLDEQALVPVADYLSWEEGLLALVRRPATNVVGFLKEIESHWALLSDGGLNLAPTAAELALLAAELLHCVQRERTILSDTPEQEEGVAWAGGVLTALAKRPEVVKAEFLWEDGPAADRFLCRFSRHFIEGKQHLFFQSLWTGLRAWILLILLAQYDAALLAQETGRPTISLEALNRALSRWCRLLDVRPMRLSFVGSARRDY